MLLCVSRVLITLMISDISFYCATNCYQNQRYRELVEMICYYFLWGNRMLLPLIFTLSQNIFEIKGGNVKKIWHVRHYHHSCFPFVISLDIEKSIRLTFFDECFGGGGYLVPLTPYRLSKGKGSYKVL